MGETVSLKSAFSKLKSLAWCAQATAHFVPSCVQLSQLPSEEGEQATAYQWQCCRIKTVQSIKPCLLNNKQIILFLHLWLSPLQLVAAHRSSRRYSILAIAVNIDFIITIMPVNTNIQPIHSQDKVTLRNFLNGAFYVKEQFDSHVLSRQPRCYR